MNKIRAANSRGQIGRRSCLSDSNASVLTGRGVCIQAVLYCLGGRHFSMQNFRFVVHIVYVFLYGCGLYWQHYK